MQDDRHKKILQTLHEHGQASVQFLASSLDVSQMTVRRDLSVLESQGMLIRKHGGAIRSEVTNNLFSFASRLYRKSEEKTYICRVAARHIDSFDVIAVDCGTTLYRLSSFIYETESLRLVTNSLPLASELMNYPNVQITLTGGDLNAERKAVYGHMAENALREYRVNKAFIGADGISIASGLTSYDEMEARITRAMAESAREVYLLCDSSKLEQDSYVRFGDLSLVSTLITDSNCAEHIVRQYESHGLHVITA